MQNTTSHGFVARAARWPRLALMASLVWLGTGCHGHGADGQGDSGASAAQVPSAAAPGGPPADPTQKGPAASGATGAETATAATGAATSPAQLGSAGGQATPPDSLSSRETDQTSDFVAVEDDAPGLGVVIATRLNVRGQAGMGHRPVDTVACGDIVDITGREGVWYAIRLGTLSGYAHSSYIFRIGAGGVRPRCSRGVAARREPDRQLPMTASRQAQAPAPASARARATSPPAEAVPDGELPVADLPSAGPAQASRGDRPTQSGGRESSRPPETGTPPQASAATAEAAPAKADKALNSEGENDAKRPSATATSAPATSPAGPPHGAGSRGATVVPATSQDLGPAQVVLAQNSSQVAPSRFPHRQHQSKLACSKCHHPVSAGAGPLKRGPADGDSNQNKRCRSCHVDGSGAVKVAAEDAMHRTCRDCHTVMGPSLAPRAPRRCAECHKP